ncbi:putative non-ribosomal peptide synthetase SirP/GliP2 [Xylona heveae TC161]|uniref:Putative non-ribosomal peptide synthetase SirP/GliP2 n=1 Tax=Xylona heveae (strain CBS 132557 / TC161) TaxID=1328760 RepID=A0A161TP71_XYLHT|nr:putative non-ribosomal peptide synthetase SirP/GliP2 [Xylona heveae TC161]KZF23926.1 putative non-ribosomal peptide synthetase SirP/GliP2 [Xylona heveae TC161]
MDAESWSQGRIDAVLETVKPKISLVTRKCNFDLKYAITAEEIEAEFNRTQPGEFSAQHSHTTEDLEEPIYTIFTSGTTGKPKGVVISQRSVFNYVQRIPFNLGVTVTDRVMLLFSIAFDACYGVLFSTLCNGGHLLLSESAGFLQDAETCTILPTTPTLLHTLHEPRRYENIRCIFLGGESPSSELVRRWWLPHRKIYNAYGPTETTISTSIAELRPEIPITLGYPIGGSQMFLLNESLEESDQGEICISGVGLAIGYFKNKELTAEKFIQWKDQRIYRTSDIGKRTAGGIQFLGREGSLVKNRGFLINLDLEVVPALLGFDGVRQAVALMHKTKLVAFVSPSKLDVNNIRVQLSEKHEEFLVPDLIFAYDELPQTSNGKLDTQALKHRLDERSDAPRRKQQHTTKIDILRAAVSDALGLPEPSIQTESSFWALGGNSLSAITLLSYLRKNEFSIQLSELFALPSLVEVSERLQRIETTLTNIPPTGAADACTAKPQCSVPMTAAQAGMVRSSIKEPTAGYMLISLEFDDISNQDAAAELRSAWQRLLARHAVFRTSFDIVSGEQKINGTYEHDWMERIVEPSALDDAVQEESANLFALTKEQNQRDIFRPANAFRLITAAGRRSILLWIVHHSRIDGWSMGLIVQELRSILRGAVLPDPPQFSTFAIDLQNEIGKQNERGKQFWSEAMDGFQDGTPLHLPTPEVPGQKYQFGEASLDVGISLPHIQRSARDFGVSSAVITYAAWTLLLGCYTSQDQAVFGTVFAGRNSPIPEIENIVGPLINTCPFPVNMRNLKTRDELLKHIQSLLLKIGDNQWSAAEALEQIASTSHSSIFETVLFLEYDLPGFAIDWQENGITLRRFNRRDKPEFGLVISIQNNDGYLRFKGLFDESLFEAPLIDRLLKHYRNLFLALIDPRVQELCDIRERMLEPSEYLTLVRNSPTFWDPYSGPSSLKDLFENGVDQWPDATAIESLTQSITYSELDAVTNYVATKISRHASLGDSVVIVSNRSLNWLIAVLSVIKAGATYVPLDTKLPLDRMGIIVQTSDAKLCIFPDESCHNLYSTISSSQKLLLHEVLGHSKLLPVPRFTTCTTKDDSAYIIFTSGSTGKPKGVRVTHGSVLSYLSYEPARMHARPGRRHAQMFSPGFDVNIAEIFGTLCYGATLVLVDPNDPFAHVGRVNATMVTPSFLSVCSPEDFPYLDTILFAGEAVPQSLSERWSGNRTVYNSYGPCECTIGCLFLLLRPRKRVTLGYPIPRVGVYLLNAQDQPVPIGVTGEICLSGIQVTDGYLGSEMASISRSRFVPDPFVPGSKMYRTGDQGVWTESMELRFLGRVDNQVKVRGYRVELEEIENTLRSACATVRQAATIVHDGNLVAFVTPDDVVIADVQDAIRSKLPAYACPSTIIALPRFPTTANQKLDRKSLKQFIQLTPCGSRAPLNSTERLVGDVWRETLNLASDVEIDATADYLDLGGNSLRQIKIARRLSAIFEIKIPMRLILEKTVLSDLARVLDEYLATKQEAPTGAPSFLSAWRTLPQSWDKASHLEQEMFQLSSSSSNPETFNVAYTVSMSGDIKLDYLEEAMKQVFLEQAIFGSSYRTEDGLLRRTKCNTSPQVIRSKNSQPGLIGELVNTPFDLSTGPLIRILLVEEDGCTTVTLVQHHIITDKVSINNFFKITQKYYTQLLQGSLPPPRAIASEPSYAAWAYWKANFVSKSPDMENLRYWTNHLGNIRTTPFTSNGASLSDSQGSSTSFTITDDPHFSGSLELYVSAVSIALCSAAGIKDTVIAIPYIDRTEPGTGELLGLFLDRLPLRIKVDEGWTEAIEPATSSVRSSIQGAIAHALPYKNILNAACEGALFDIIVVYNRREDSLSSQFSLPNAKTEEEIQLRPTGAKFPLLVEFTETTEGTVCEFEYMENIVSTPVTARIQENIQRVVGQFIGRNR